MPEIDYCRECRFLKDVVEGEGVCKIRKPETQVTTTDNQIRRVNGWTKVKETESACDEGKPI